MTDEEPTTGDRTDWRKLRSNWGLIVLFGSIVLFVWLCCTGAFSSST